MVYIEEQVKQIHHLDHRRSHAVYLSRTTRLNHHAREIIGSHEMHGEKKINEKKENNQNGPLKKESISACIHSS